MQLSEAIMLGSTMVDPYDPDVWNRCALGMAGAATGVRRQDDHNFIGASPTDINNLTNTMVFISELAERFPVLRIGVTHPCCSPCGGHRLARLTDVIVHLYDYHLNPSPSPERWTLDQIVDFVRRIEAVHAVLRGVPSHVENDPQRQTQDRQLNPCAAPDYFAPPVGEIDGTRLGDVPDPSEARPAPAEVPA